MAKTNSIKLGRIASEIDFEVFPSPEKRLLLAVINRAALDLRSMHLRTISLDAARYILNTINQPHTFMSFGYCLLQCDIKLQGASKKALIAKARAVIDDNQIAMKGKAGTLPSTSGKLVQNVILDNY